MSLALSNDEIDLAITEQEAKTNLDTLTDPQFRQLEVYGLSSEFSEDRIALSFVDRSENSFRYVPALGNGLSGITPAGGSMTSRLPGTG